MFSLRLLGGATIEGPQGPLGGRVAQRRRLALLAFLALARERPVSRDRLHAVFWPESDTERARHSLNHSLYEVRKELGESVILVAGEDLRLNAQVVRSDVAEFEEALERDDPGRAVAAYGGPFLDGLHLSGAREFERWMDGERDRLGRAYMKALERLAEQAEADGETERAVEWWRRLAAADPYHARWAVRLMQALEAAGDRAGALRHSSVHIRMLREELEAAADPEVIALAERLRTVPMTAAAGPDVRPGPSAAASPATPALPAGDDRVPPVQAPEPQARSLPWRTAALTVGGLAAVLSIGILLAPPGSSPPDDLRSAASPTRSIAVLPFENLTGKEEDAAFTHGMHSDLITAFSRVPTLTVISRASVLPYQDAGTSLRQIAEELDVDVLLEGGVQRAGSRVRVNVQLSDAKTGKLLWGESYDRELTVGNLFAIQSGITERIVASLEASLTPAQRQRIATPPTGDLTAYQLYHQASQAFDGTRAGNLETSRLLRLALVADAAFVPAWSNLAVSYGWRTPNLGFPPSAWDSALIFARRAVDLDSLHAGAYVALSVIYGNQGHVDHAERSARRALELNANDPLALRQLGEAYRDRGEFVEALRHHKASFRLVPDQLAFRTWVGVTYANLGVDDESERWYRGVLTLVPNYLAALEGMGILFLQRGQTDSARHYAELMAAHHAEDARGLATAAAIRHYLREHERARDHALSAAAIAPGPLVRSAAGAGYGILGTTILGFAYLETGDVEGADRLFDESLAFIEPLVAAGANSPRWPYEIALIQAARGDTRGAIASLQTAYERGFRWTWMLDLEPMLDPIRDEPRFQRLVARVRMDVDAMRRRLQQEDPATSGLDLGHLPRDGVIAAR